MHNVKQKTRLWLLILAAVLVIAAAGAALWYFRSVYPSLTVELGESLPSPGAFLRRGGRAAYIDPPELDRHTEANYELSLRTALGIRHTTLLVRDSTPPRAEDARLSVLPGELPEPAQTVKNIVDASEVTVHWAEVPDLFTPGPHTLSVLLRDVCGNEARMPVTVTVAEVLDSLSLPVGSPRPEAADFVRYWNGEAAFRTDLGAIDWEHPGAVPIALEVGGKSYGSTLVLTDGDAPVFTLLDFAAALGQELTPEDFVEKCSDLSEVRFSFGSRPDTSRLGEYTVTITAADAAGNSASQSATLYVVEAVATLEAGSEPVYPWQIVRQYGDAFLGYTLPTTDALIPDTPGARTLSLSSWRGDEHTVGLVIRDTLPPEARTAYVECYTGYPCPPEYFIAEVRDASEVTMEFLTEPDWN
ncbi:MAG: hypothetical protein IJ617_03590, partial [Oscillospiraceae bacterium]|nr:hypothetical protein [Oscillospiraceae bacterium]